MRILDALHLAMETIRYLNRERRDDLFSQADEALGRLAKQMHRRNARLSVARELKKKLGRKGAAEYKILSRLLRESKVRGSDANHGRAC